MPRTLPCDRLRYLGLALVTIGLGLAVHLHGAALGTAARDVAGDALWAAMMTWWIGVVAPTARPVARGVVAYAICVAVEFSQLLHAPGLDAVRATRAGHLVLGSGFDPRDLAAYAVGVIVALLIDRTLMARWR
ncbi:MAG TPA: DUF2809 domain-containing protein [Gemmatimonadaceae bacterium]|nr:DUF2809 domain-containing protein [Gemmatimonadaceae bacterium]